MTRTNPKLRPPPNYFSRGVQTRLLVLVTMFMLVLLLMGEAAKPKNWQWLFADRRTSAGAAADG
ncbi:MAG: hypothetical protein J5I93_01210, partial [Pirellulaceae bacterium]|nr:hypothetical protein [Pirellulaceae bacterium]